MESLKKYNIQFVGLNTGIHKFEYEIGEKFFTNFNNDTSLIEDGNIHVDLSFKKSSTMLVLSFLIKGTIKVNCDICLDSLNLNVKNEFDQIIKFSDIETDSFNDEITILPSSEYEINIARYIYEFIHLCIPAKVTHSEGECNESVKSIVDEYLLTEEVEKELENDDVDPRWAALQELKSKN